MLHYHHLPTELPNEFLQTHIHQDLLHLPHSFILVKLSLEKATLNLGLF